MSLSFLEANKIVVAGNNLPTESFVLAASGQTEKLTLFIKAASIQQGFNSSYKALPFNTLQQYIISPATTDAHHVFILFPWDVFPDMDWRSGVTTREVNKGVVFQEADDFIEKLARFPSKSLLYIPAAAAPATSTYQFFMALAHHLQASFLKAGATLLPADFFSLASYLSSGSPFAGKFLSPIADAVVSALPRQSTVAKKVLVTDFDNVMWRGVVSEDGIDAIQCSNESAGYIHYIYQSYLLKLKSQGVLIAGVTRNDHEGALLPFRQGVTLFKEHDFVSVHASYQSKSAQIKALSSNLNVSMDSIVFVDDNLLELEEVRRALPAVECRMFPGSCEDAPGFFAYLQQQFSFMQITDEDRQRTELYKTRFKAAEISYLPGADITDYLRSLEMVLTVTKCDASNYSRPLQLINKANQFSLNGLRVSEDQLRDLIACGATLYSCSLADKFGDHGQISSILVSEQGVVSYFVISCRVFQRKVEYAVLLLLADVIPVDTLMFDYYKTDKNIPFQMFISDAGFSLNGSELLLDLRAFVNKNQTYLELFDIDSALLRIPEDSP